MRPTRTEKLEQEAKVAALMKTKEEKEENLKWAVEKFDLDFSPPYLQQEEKIMLDFFPRRWPDLLKVYPEWESLPPMQRLNCVFVIKFNLDRSKFPLHKIRKDHADMNIQEAISEKLANKSGSFDAVDAVDPALVKFKK